MEVNKRVYALLGGEDWEGETLLSIYSTEELALTAREEYDNTYYNFDWLTIEIFYLDNNPKNEQLTYRLRKDLK